MAGIARSRTKRRPRVAFVLSGGGNLGAIQIGMLRALTERAITPDVVLGCSIGALNGAGFAADPTLSGIRHLESVWRRTEAYDVMPSSRIPGPVQLLRKGEALHSNAGLRKTIEAFLVRRDTFEELAVEFQCVATDVESAMEKWFTAGAIEAPILASAALPAVYPPVMIDGIRYVDGGVVDNVPITRAVDLGAKKIYVLHVGLHGRPQAEIRRPLDAALMAYWIARNGRFARDLATLPKGVEVVVLPPGDRPDIRYDDFSQTAVLLNQGYEGAAAHLDALAAAEATEPSLADRLRREMFETADWRRVLERRRGKAVLEQRPPEEEAELDALADDLG